MIRALCASLLLFAMSWPASADNAKPLTTMLLVAQAELRDPNFKDSVVLVMNNIGPAPAGIIINTYEYRRIASVSRPRTPDAARRQGVLRRSG